MGYPSLVVKKGEEYELMFVSDLPFERWKVTYKVHTLSSAEEHKLLKKADHELSVVIPLALDNGMAIAQAVWAEPGGKLIKAEAKEQLGNPNLFKFSATAHSDAELIALRIEFLELSKIPSEKKLEIRDPDRLRAQSAPSTHRSEGSSPGMPSASLANLAVPLALREDGAGAFTSEHSTQEVPVTTHPIVESFRHPDHTRNPEEQPKRQQCRQAETEKAEHAGAPVDSATRRDAMDRGTQILAREFRGDARRFRHANRQQPNLVQPVQPRQQPHLEGTERAITVIENDVFGAIHAGN